MTPRRFHSGLTQRMRQRDRQVLAYLRQRAVPVQIDEVAAVLGLSVAHTRALLAGLEAAGEVRRHLRGNHGRGRRASLFESIDL